MYSNTCLLYKRGWSGINIDINPTSIDLFNIVRPKDFNLCTTIDKDDKEFNLYYDDPFSPLNTLDKEFYKKIKKKNNRIFEDKTVKNRMIYQLTSFGNVMKLSKDIKYRFDELKELNKNNSKFLAQNKHKIFTSQNDIESEELSTIFNKTLEDIKYKYEKVYVQIEDKIDYLCFNLFHSTFNSEAFEHHKNSKTEDKRFI